MPSSSAQARRRRRPPARQAWRRRRPAPVRPGDVAALPRVGRGDEPPGIGGIVGRHDPTIHDHGRPRIEGHVHLDAPGLRSPSRIELVAEPEAGTVTAGAKTLSVAISRIAAVEAGGHVHGKVLFHRPLGSTSVEIRAPLPVVGRLIAGLAWQVVDPVAPVGDAVAIIVDDHAVGDPCLRRLHVRRPVRDEVEEHIVGVDRHVADVDAGEDVGSGVARWIDVGGQASARRSPPPAGSGRTGAGQSSFRLSRVQASGTGRLARVSRRNRARRSCLDARWASEWARARGAAWPPLPESDSSEMPGATARSEDPACRCTRCTRPPTCGRRPPAVRTAPPAARRMRSR